MLALSVGSSVLGTTFERRRNWQGLSVQGDLLIYLTEFVQVCAYIVSVFVFVFVFMPAPPEGTTPQWREGEGSSIVIFEAHSRLHNLATIWKYISNCESWETSICKISVQIWESKYRHIYEEGRVGEKWLLLMLIIWWYGRHMGVGDKLLYYSYARRAISSILWSQIGIVKWFVSGGGGATMYIRATIDCRIVSNVQRR